MRLATMGEHIHEVTFYAWKGSLFMGIWCMFFVYMLLSQNRAPSGPLVGIALTGLIAVLFYERGRFTFNTQQRTVTWRRKSLYSDRSGEIPFSDIRDIILAKGWAGNYDDGGWRIEIRTKSGSIPKTRVHHIGKKGRIEIYAKNGNIPMTRCCYGFGQKRMQSIVDQLVTLLSGEDAHQ